MSDFLEKITVFSPAKVNLHLAVKNRRNDGFHDLESVFLAVNFGDTLHFQPIKGENSTEIAMEGLEFPVPTEKNIVFKAISLFRQKTGFSGGLKVRVEKRIPLGGGLGGGSSNAAAALLVMNKIAGSLLDFQTLLEMAAGLGSDVPFFIYETTAAMVTGRGDRIEPVEAPQLFLVLVNPGFPSDTAAAFRLLDEHRSSVFTTTHTNSREPAVQRFSDIREGSWLNFNNDFLEVFGEKEKAVYNEIISQLKAQGAQYANLSGAGSTCFGVFKEKEEAQKAALALQGKWPFVQECGS